jgi:ABC-type branched-subunit amino acid transport system ATPase component
LTPLLSVEGVTAGYAEMDILHDVSMRVGAGETVTIIGPNGAGKTTLMRAIFGLVTIRRGDIAFAGQPITGMRASALVARGLSFVPQVENVFPSLTVRENLEIGYRGPTTDEAPTLERSLAVFPQLVPRLGAKAGGLSGGERQMLAIGRALMVRPKILLLDEPSASLSPLMVDMVFEKIADISRSGVACLLVEQNARAALQISHRGYVLVAGQNRAEGSGSALLADPEIAHHYFGTS